VICTICRLYTYICNLACSIMLSILLLTLAYSRRSRAFIRSLRMCVCVCMCVCQHSEAKTTELIITKVGRWIVHDKSWSLILFEVKRSNVKVSVSLILLNASPLVIIAQFRYCFNNQCHRFVKFKFSVYSAHVYNADL